MRCVVCIHEIEARSDLSIRVETSSRSRLPAARKFFEARDGALVLRCEGVWLGNEREAFDVTATVRLDGDDGESRWSMRVDNRSRKWTLAEIRFPCLANMVRPGEGDVLEAAGPLGAQLHKSFAGRNTAHEVKFPTTAPPVTAFLSGDSGLYIGVHDASRRIKRFRYGPGVDFSVAAPVECFRDGSTERWAESDGLNFLRMA